MSKQQPPPTAYQIAKTFSIDGAAIQLIVPTILLMVGIDAALTYGTSNLHNSLVAEKNQRTVLDNVATGALACGCLALAAYTATFNNSLFGR